jgi:hypothetical protein
MINFHVEQDFSSRAVQMGLAGVPNRLHTKTKLSQCKMVYTLSD